MQLRRTTARWACDWACCARSPVIHPAPGIFSLAEMYQCLVVPDQYVARVLLARGLDFGGSLFHFAVLQIERNQSYCSAHMGVIDALRLEECAFCCIFIIADEFQVTQLSPSIRVLRINFQRSVQARLGFIIVVVRHRALGQLPVRGGIVGRGLRGVLE